MFTGGGGGVTGSTKTGGAVLAACTAWAEASEAGGGGTTATGLVVTSPLAAGVVMISEVTLAFCPSLGGVEPSMTPLEGLVIPPSVGPLEEGVGRTPSVGMAEAEVTPAVGVGSCAEGVGCA